MERKDIVRKITKAAEACMQYIYPQNIYCICCGRETDADSLYSMCSECLQTVNWANGKLCSSCGKPLESWYPAMLCSECSNKTRAFDAGITGFLYDESARNMIHEFKYHGRSFMARNFSEILYDKIDALDCKCDIVVAVPMYREKERRRGYNQAALLAEFTAEKLGIPCENDVIIRVRDTAPMNKLSASDRKRNLDDAFGITDAGRLKLPGKHVLLVDDIYTTGTTTEHCSALMKENGAVKVTILSLAAGRNQRKLPDISKLERTEE